MYEYILLDLDGTIIDNGEGIFKGILYALDKFGIKEENQSVLNSFIGPPLFDSFMKNYSFSKEKALKAVEYYRVYYRETGIYENRLYDGIPELIKKLKNIGKTVILATAKPQYFAEQILKQHDLYKYFDCLVGATLDSTLNYKNDIIRVAMEKSGITDKSKAVMIGDRYYDIEGALENGIDSVGVLYGYGDYNELKGAGATNIAMNTDEIFNIVNSDWE